jgi:signal transduction histidine kinase
VAEAEWLAALRELEQTLGEDLSVEGIEPGPARLRGLGAALRQRQQHLRELQGDKDAVLGTVAHDLRTPLVAIQGFVQLLQLSADKFGLADKQREYVERIRQAALQMNRLVEDLRTARRLEEGSLSIRPAAVTLGEFLDDMLGLHREAARPRGVAVECLSGPGAPLTAVFDPDRIAQALGNLVQNAVRVTPEGGRVVVTVDGGEGWLSFRVTDSGPGISPDMMPQLFARISQDRRDHALGRGHGLGLYICSQVAGLHGGNVNARNRPEGGAEFCLKIPLVTVVDEAEADRTAGVAP